MDDKYCTAEFHLSQNNLALNNLEREKKSSLYEMATICNDLGTLISFYKGRE